MGFASAGCLVHGTRDVGQGGKKRKSRSRQAGRRQDLGQGTPSLPLECPFQPRCERRPANGASRAPVTPPRRTPSTTPAPWPNDLIPTLAGPASHSTSQNRCQPCRRGKSVGVRQKQVCALPAGGSSSHASCGRCFGPGCATPSCSGCVVFKTPCPLPELGERERASPSQSLCPPCANRASSCVAYNAQKLVPDITYTPVAPAVAGTPTTPHQSVKDRPRQAPQDGTGSHRQHGPPRGGARLCGHCGRRHWRVPAQVQRLELGPGPLHLHRGGGGPVHLLRADMAGALLEHLYPLARRPVYERAVVGVFWPARRSRRVVLRRRLQLGQRLPARRPVRQVQGRHRLRLPVGGAVARVGAHRTLLGAPPRARGCPRRRLPPPPPLVPPQPCLKGGATGSELVKGDFDIDFGFDFDFDFEIVCFGGVVVGEGEGRMEVARN